MHVPDFTLCFFLRCRVLSIVIGVLALSSALHADGSLDATAGRPHMKPSRTIPLAFERNEGQYAPAVKFLARTRQYSAAVSDKGIVFELSNRTTQAPISLLFANSLHPAPRGVDELAFSTNLFVGQDASKWRSGVRNFERVTFDGLYPGIDSVYYANGDKIEHDFVVRPGADAAQIAMNLEGADDLRQDASGNLLLSAGEGTLELKKPFAYQQDAHGRRVPVAASFELKPSRTGGGEIRFALGSYDHSRALVIDPVIVYATFVTGTSGSTAQSVATGPTGNVYLSGTTLNSGLLPPPTAIDTCNGTPCVFVASFTNETNGSAINWITYFGPSSGSHSLGVTSSIANHSTLFVGGFTDSTTMPNGSANINNPTGGFVGFVTGIELANGAVVGTNLVYVDPKPTNNTVQALAFDSAGDLFAAGSLGSLTGDTLSPPPTPETSFAITPAVTTYSSSQPATQPPLGNSFVMEYSAANPLSGNPLYFTYIQKDSLITGLAVEPSTNKIHVAGVATGGFSLSTLTKTNNHMGIEDAFELTFSTNTAARPTVNSLYWIYEAGVDVHASALAVDSSGDSYLFGETAAPSLKEQLTANGFTSSACAPSLKCSITGSAPRGFVVRFPASGTTANYTYIAGSKTKDTVVTGALSPDGTTVYAAGQTDAAAGTQLTTSSLSASQKLAANQDLSLGGANNMRGYVAALKSDLSSVFYVADIGGKVGPDQVVALATEPRPAVPGVESIDVAAQISNHTNQPFTDAAALQPISKDTTPTNTDGYLAELTYTPSTGAGLSATGTPAITNNEDGTTTFSLPLQTTDVGSTVQVEATATIASPGVFLFSSGSVTGPSGASVVSATCAVSASKPNISCVIPNFPTGAAGVMLNFTATVKSSIPALATVKFTATSSTSTVATGSVSAKLPGGNLILKPSPNPPVFSPATTEAGLSLAPATAVSFAFTLQNPSTTTPPSTNPTTVTLVTFKPPIVSGFPAFTVTGVSSCQIGSGEGLQNDGSFTCDARVAGGATNTYTVTGYYNDKAIFPDDPATPSTRDGSHYPISVTIGKALLPTASISEAPAAGALTIRRVISLTPKSGIPSLKTNLYTAAAPATVQYTYAVTNNGPGVAYGVDVVASGYPSTILTSKYTLSATDFKVITSSCGSESSSSPFHCVLEKISPGTTVTLSVQAAFPDLAAVPMLDAVPPGYSQLTYLLSAQTSVTGSYYATGPLPTFSTNVTVHRDAQLTFTPMESVASPVVVSCPQPFANLLLPWVDEGPSTTSVDTDKTSCSTIGYSFSVKNNGSNASTATQIRIPVPVANGHTLAVPATVSALSDVSIPDSITGCNLVSETYACGLKPVAQTITNGIPSGGSLKISFSGSFPEGTVPNTATFVPTTGASASVFADVISPAMATEVEKVVNVYRSSHLVVNKTVSFPRVPSALTTFTDKVDPNLDENPGRAKFGNNDEIEFAIAVGNAGINDEPSFTVTDTLPPYFSVFGIYLRDNTSYLANPTKTPGIIPNGTQISGISCKTSSGVALNLNQNNALNAGNTPIISTSAGSATFTCTVSATLYADNSKATTTQHTPGSRSLTIVYQGKFQDNAPSADNILSTASTHTFIPVAAEASAKALNAVDDRPSSADATTSLAFPSYKIQRAAELVFKLAAALPLQAPTAAGAADIALPVDQIYTHAPETAEAQPLYPPPPPRTSAPPPIFNCMRYKFYVINPGPNRARQPGLKLNLTKSGAFPQAQPANFVPVDEAVRFLTTAAPEDTALPSSCPFRTSYDKSIAKVSGANASVTANDTAAISLLPITQDVKSAMVLDFDGYFDVGTLSWTNDSTSKCPGNCGQVTPLATTPPSDPGIVPSGLGLTTHSVAATVPAVTVVNTPFNLDSTLRFNVTPYAAGDTQAATITFNVVKEPGITVEDLSTPAKVVMPYGANPWYKLYPAVAGSNPQLYQPGRTKPNYYTLSSTASSQLPTVCVYNPANTGKDVLSGAFVNALTDNFVKPERALMWIVNNPPSGTIFEGVPHLTGTGTYGKGDITSSVTPFQVNFYTADPAYGKPPSASMLALQKQPAEVCGQPGEIPPPAAAMTLAVLEPVNFPPVVVGKFTPTNSVPGKGAEDQSYTLSLTLPAKDTPTPANNFVQATYDYNDADPCYTGSATKRAQCNDNRYLEGWVFGGGSVQDLQLPQIVGPEPLNITPPTSPLPAPFDGTFNAILGAQLYLAVADKVGYGTQDCSNPNLICTTSAENANGPFLSESSNADPSALDCDPGAYNSYYVSVAGQCTIVGPTGAAGYQAISQISGAPLQGYIPASNGYIVGNITLASFANGSGASSALQPLPLPTDVFGIPSPPAGPVVSATVTAGQTTGFSWGWLSQYQDRTLPDGTTVPFKTTASLNLACESIGSATPPAGMQCILPSTYSAPPVGSTNGIDIFVTTLPTEAQGNVRGLANRHDSPKTSRPDASSQAATYEFRATATGIGADGQTFTLYTAPFDVVVKPND